MQRDKPLVPPTISPEGKDRRWRNRVAAKVAEQSPRVFGDEVPIRALEGFLARVCRPEE